MDKYKNFEELKKNESVEHYTIHYQERRSGVAVIAPHGGGIEPGTLELAQAIAGAEHSYCAFDAKRPSRNAELHITSTHFDEPKAKGIVSESNRVIAIHGCEGEDETVYIGGLDAELIERVRAALIAAEFLVEKHVDPELQGEFATNICNQGATHKGVQLEISAGLRSTMFQSLRRKGRESKTDVFAKFVAAVRHAFD